MTPQTVTLMWSGKMEVGAGLGGMGAPGGVGGVLHDVGLQQPGGTSNIEQTKALTADGDVVRGGGGWRGGHPLGDRLGRRIEHEICEGEGAIVHSHQPEASVILPGCCFQLQQPACGAAHTHTYTHALCSVSLVSMGQT